MVKNRRLESEGRVSRKKAFVKKNKKTYAMYASAVKGNIKLSIEFSIYQVTYDIQIFRPI